MGWNGFGGPLNYGLAGKGLWSKDGRSSLMESLFGKKESFDQLPTMDPQQTQLFQQLISGLSGGNAGGGAMGSGMNFLQGILGGDTSKFEAPLMRQFNEQTVPGIAERFSGMGAGSQGSGAFGQQLGAAGAGLSENLGALRGGLQMQALGPLMQMLQQAMGNRSFENIHRPSTPGFMGQMGQGMGQAAGMLPFMFM
jgi:hypothetical protein